VPADVPALYLICYDIADPRRLVRVHRYLKGHGIPVQYSVFVAKLRPRSLDLVMAGISERIDPRADDVRAYALPATLRIERIGREYFPEGLSLLDGAKDLLTLLEVA